MRILIIGSKGNTKGVHSADCFAEEFRLKQFDIVFLDPIDLKYLLTQEDFDLYYEYKECISISWLMKYNNIKGIELILIDENPFHFTNDVNIPVFSYHKYLYRHPIVFFPDAIFYGYKDMLYAHSKQLYQNYFYYIRDCKKEIMNFAVNEKLFKPEKKIYKGICGIGYRRSIESWVKAASIVEGPNALFLKKQTNKFRKFGFTFFNTPIEDKKYREILPKCEAIWIPIANFQYITRRMFEAMACKTLCIIVLQDEHHKEILKGLGYINGEHYIGVNKVSEIEQAFIETTNKKSIIKNAYKLTLEKHTYKNRVEQIIELYDKEFKDVIKIPDEYIALDLGCGKAKHKDTIGVDIKKLSGVDIIHDLNNIPYPFKGGSIDLIIMDNILEHLDNPSEVIKECYRILKPEGKLKIKVVYWNHKYTYSDPQHKHAFTEMYFDFFVGRNKDWYYNFQFSDMNIEYIFDPNAKKKFGVNEDILLNKGYFHCNIIQGMVVTLIK